jgi:alkylhydroperoxidase/carboxymuconolactone decarboxylase family protein YurZ
VSHHEGQAIVEPVLYPLSGQANFTSNLQRLREVSPALADAFRGLRVAADAHACLEPKQRELCLLAGFAAGRNEGGFRVHCTRALEAGATVAEIEQVVLLMLGTSLGLAPTVETLTWVHDELL